MRQMMRVAAMGIAGLVALSAVAGGTYVEYVDSDYNQKAVINTGYFVNPKTRLALDYAYHQFNRGDNPSQSNLQQRAIGLTGGSGSLSLQQYINGSGQYAYSCSNNVNAGWWSMNAGNVTQERVIFTVSIPDRIARLYRNGSRIGAPGAFGPIKNTAKYPLGLFASKGHSATTNAVSGYGNFATVRFWSLKIWEGDALVRDYRPYRDENGTYCVKERITGNLHYTVENKPLTGGAPFDPDAETSNVVTIAPGYNVTTNVPAFGGEVTVRVNEGLGKGGIVNMAPYNWYNGPTYLDGGTLVADNLLPAASSSLGGGGTLYMDAGTLKYTGTGTFNRDIVTTRAVSATGTNDTRSVIFDVTGDLTLAGKFTNPLGGFVKTGPGILRIPGGSGMTNRISAIGGNGNLNAVTWNANGDSTIHGSAFEVLEGTLVLGEKGGVFYINGNGADAWVGKVCVDPRTNPGVQDKEGVLEIRGGTVIVENWLMIGVKNGFEGSTPEGKPQSGIRMYGGTFDAMISTSLGRNKNSGVYTDAGGNKLKLNTAPFLEVHGGTMRLRNTSRVVLCDNPGADSRVWVDGGTLIVRNGDNTSGSEMIVGNCADGDTTLPSVADVTVCSNGTFDVTGFRIVNANRSDVTANLNVIDGGIYRNNQLYKGSSKADHALNLLVDGGIMEIRWAGYANWIKSDLTKAEIGTRGAVFRSGSDSGSPKNVIDTVGITFTAKDTHPGETPQGVTFGTVFADKNSGFRFTVPQAWAGPTRILAGGICELTGTGALPSTSDVTLETKGTLTVAANQTFPSFTVGTEGTVGNVKLGFTTNATITAAAFEVKPNTAVEINLFETINTTGTAADSPSAYILEKNATPLTTAGTYTLLTVPAADAADLTALAQSLTLLNPAADTSYAFAVTSGDGTASLAVTVAAVPAETVAAADGETTNVTVSVTGDQTLNTNPTVTGGGTVNLGDTLAGFGGRLVSGSGTTTISDLSFVDSMFEWVVGPGTLWYTGAATTVPGLTVNAGANRCGELKIDNDVTLSSAHTIAGSVCKSGTGDLILKGNGYFYLGNSTVSWNASNPGYNIPKANGDGRTGGFGALNVSEGRIVVGTKNDASDAPTIDAAGLLTVGMRTTDTPGTTETVGEFVMNNGVLTLTSGINIGYYLGLPETTPEGVTLRPKLTLNGGTITTTYITMGVDATGQQTCSPELEINGGEIIFGNNLTVGNQSASAGATNKISVNDGLLSCKDINFGYAGDSLGCAPGIFEINGGEVQCTTFVVGNKAVSGRQELYLNGGVLKCARISHAGVANATAGAGSAAVYFRGTTVYPGYRRTLGTSYEFGGTSANNRMEYFVGAAGLKFDFTEWVKGGDDNGIINFRNPVQHDPECAGEDGGILFKGAGTGIRTTVIMRGEAKGCSFNGPVRATDGAEIGVDNGWTEFLTKRFEIGPGSGLRSSSSKMIVNNVTLGEANATEPVLLDFAAGSTDTGLIVSNELAVLSPIIVGFHRNGGASNVYGSQDGTYPVLIYPESLEGNVPLSMFVANPELAESSMTFTQETIASGKYSGWRMVKVTIGRAATVPGTTWTGASGDGKWTTGGNWDGGAAPDGRDAVATFPAANAGAVTVDGDVTAGQITLNGGAGTGYTFTGNAPKLEHTDIRTPPAVVAESGEHVFANGLATDDFYQRCYETDANGGRTGAIGVYAKTGSKVTINGTVATDPQRQLYVNNPTSGGGTTVLNAPVAGTGVTVNSGKLEFSDATILDGKTLTVGPGTVHYTGNGGVMSANVAFSPGMTNRTATIRTDGDLTIAGLVTTPTQGAVMKTGPGTLRLVGTGSMRMGSTICNVRWNSTDPWPANGDSIQNGNGSFCLDEGDLVVGGPGQTLTIGNGDVFIGSQPRGWSYTTNRITVSILGGTINVSYLGIDHGMRRVDGSGNPVACYLDWNQYGGTVNAVNIYAGYDLTSSDNHATTSINLFNGQMNVSGSVFRFGQTYRKANTTGPDPHTYINIYDGAVLARTGAYGVNNNIHMPYSESTAQLSNHQGRAPDATLNMYGGAFTNAYLFLVGHNGGSATFNLHGGVLNCENILHLKYNSATTADTTYRVFNNKEGATRIYWNGGTFMPISAKMANDPLASDANNATLGGLTEVLVSTNGAVLSTATLVADTYTIAQPLLHDPALEGEADGGLTIRGNAAKTVALTGANTYTGDTTVEEGTLSIPANADASALPSNSVVVVAEGATLSMANGTAAGVGALRFDMGTQYGTLAGFAPARSGKLYVTGVDRPDPKGLVMPVTVTDAQHPYSLTRWGVYIDGVLDEKLSAFVRNNTIVLDGRPGLYLIVR